MSDSILVILVLNYSEEIYALDTSMKKYVIIILVYIFKMKNYSEERYVIPILALFDLCAIIFTTIYFILDYVYLSIFNLPLFAN
jgi:predicted membrane protein